MAALRKRGKTYYAYWRENGRVLQKSLGADIRMAKIKLGEIEKRLMSKRNGAHQEITWDEFVSKYLDYCRANQAKETVVRNEVVFKNL